MMKNDEIIKKVIRKTYKAILENAESNTPLLLIIAKSDMNNIINNIQYFESALVDARNSRDNWRTRAEKAEKKLKELNK